MRSKGAGRFILVHGTFARGAAWTRPKSTLHDALNAEFPDAIIEHFEWSGKNSHEARREAGYDLKTHIRSRVQSNDGRIIWVIAHSHGGNVALRALADFDKCGQIGGLVCIATPFITAKPRQVSSFDWIIGGIGSWIFATLVALVYVFAALALALLVIPDDDSFLKTHIWFVAAAMVGFYVGGHWIFGASKVWGKSLMASLFHRIDRRRLENAALSIPAIARLPVIAAFVAGDEAAVGMKVARNVGEIPALVWPLVSVTFKAALAMFAAALLIGSFMEGALDHSGFEPIYAAIAWPLFSTVVPITLVVAIFMVCVPFLVRGLWVFGGERLLDNIASSITVSKFPPSEIHRAAHLPFKIGMWPLRLRHSRLYDDQRFLSVLCRLIRNPKEIQFREERDHAPKKLGAVWTLLAITSVVGGSAYQLRGLMPAFLEEYAISAGPLRWQDRYPDLVGYEVYDKEFLKLTGEQPDRVIRGVTVVFPYCALIGEVWSADKVLVRIGSFNDKSFRGETFNWPSQGRRKRQVIDAHLRPGRYWIAIQGERGILDQSLNQSIQILDADIRAVCWRSRPPRIWTWRDWLF